MQSETTRTEQVMPEHAKILSGAFTNTREGRDSAVNGMSRLGMLRVTEGDAPNMSWSARYSKAENDSRAQNKTPQTQFESWDVC